MNFGSLGHDVRLIPPQYVRPFVKTNKNDAADAEGICEAIVRPRPWKNASYEVGGTLCFSAVTVETRLIDWRVRLERGDQALIAAISGPAPKIAIIRFRL